MDFGLLVDSSLPPSDLIDVATSAERLGFNSVWYPDEKFFHDCYIGLTLIAANTGSCRLGPCVTDPYSRHPILTAVAIGTLAEIAPGRTWLGIGPGGRGFQAMGIDRKSPVAAVREAVYVIRQLLSGSEVDFRGEVISLQKRSLDFEPPADVPIFIATGHGPMIQELSGEIGDGAMIANVASERALAPVIARVEKGAAKKGRSLDDIHLISRIDVSCHSHASLAREAVAPAILSAMRSSYPELAYLRILPEFSLSSTFLEVLARRDYASRMHYRDPRNAAPLIPPALYEHLAIAGSPDEVRARIDAIQKMNVFHEITIRLVPCADQTMTESLELLARTIMPRVGRGDAEESIEELSD